MSELTHSLTHSLTHPRAPEPERRTAVHAVGSGRPIVHHSHPLHAPPVSLYIRQSRPAVVPSGCCLRRGYRYAPAFD